MKLSEKDLRDAVEVVKDGAGTMSRFSAFTWEDPQTTARAIDIIGGLAFTVDEAAANAGEILEILEGKRYPRGNERDLIQYDRAAVDRAKKNLEAFEAAHNPAFEVIQ